MVQAMIIMFDFPNITPAYQKNVKKKIKNDKLPK
ncbi:hypothetical protein LAZ67_8001861, partial [Cordylochernes scorpioides]